MTTRHARVLLAACSVIYLAIATRISDGFGRTQFDNGAFADFFDIQARALLRGDLALPPNSIGLEAFVVDGREQMYFGLFPALLRLPVTAITEGLSGQLTIVSSFLAWLLFVVAAWALTDRALVHLLSDHARWPDSALVMLWKVGIALGTPMLMLAGPVWVFSEAIMWGVASCAFVQLRLFRELEAPSVRNQWWLAVALVLAVLNRPTLGVGCLFVVACVVLWRTWRQRRVGSADLRLAGITLATAVVLVTPNMIRFGRPLGPPMEDQLLSQVDEQRIAMLDFAGGDFVDARYLPTNLFAYLRPDGMSLSGWFPYLDAPHQLPHVFGGAVYDITYRTPSLPASTPLLFGLAVLGAVLGALAIQRPAGDRQTAALRLLLLAAAGVPAAGTLMIWGFIAPRYLADFVALLLPLGLLGLAGVLRFVETRPPTVRRGVMALTVVVVGWSVMSNVAMTVTSSYFTGPDGDAGELVGLQGRGGYWADATRLDAVDDFRFDRHDPPPVGKIAVLGVCEGAWVSNGEPVDPWLTLSYGRNEFRRVFEVMVDEDAALPLDISLGTFANALPVDPTVPNTFEVSLVVDSEGSFSLDLADEIGVVNYPLDDVDLGERVELAVTSDPVRREMFFEIDDQTIEFGHLFTRTLYTPAGQVTSFTDGATAPGVAIMAIDVDERC